MSTMQAGKDGMMEDGHAEIDAEGNLDRFESSETFSPVLPKPFAPFPNSGPES